MALFRAKASFLLKIAQRRRVRQKLACKNKTGGLGLTVGTMLVTRVRKTRRWGGYLILVTIGVICLAGCLYPMGPGFQSFSAPSPTGSYQYSYTNFGPSATFGTNGAEDEHLSTPLDSMSDQELSSRITDYLHRHKLPLVQATVNRDKDGQRRLVLSGFVATDFGKIDAVNKVMSYLNHPNWQVSNFIRVSPDLAALNANYRKTHQTQDNGGTFTSSDGSLSSAPASSSVDPSQLPPGAQAYIQQQQAAQSMMMPPVMMPMGGMMIGNGFGFGTGGFGFGTGFGPYPFGGFGIVPGFGFFPP